MRNPSSSGNNNMSKSTITPCCSKVGIKRGPWTPEEDELLASYVRKEGEGRWRTLPKRAGLLRCGKSCRLRWMNYLRPNVKRGRIAPDEEDLILRLHRLLGNRWSLIAGRIPGRTDNEIKNYWNTHLSKKLISQGIDPRTHKPLNPTLTNYPEQVASIPQLSCNPTFFHHQLQETGTSRAGTTATKISEDLTITNVDGHQDQFLNDGTRNWPTCDETLTGLQNGPEHNIINAQDSNLRNANYDDAFSSFLDSLLNDNIFLHQQQLQPMEPLVHPFSSSEEGFNQRVWDDELVVSSMAAFGEKEGSLNPHPS
ncbi:hypothetical protein Tsubulata_003093 [Turnera subulata]|uniref:Uncharacterized protein n=1 Tax=Turnera subulata TaxID=218843 RepID=A0A9Q0G9A4_9ROSI|nr:hypothetical protein Tsubulata_003093 [Turnera subulata]